MCTDRISVYSHSTSLEQSNRTTNTLKIILVGDFTTGKSTYMNTLSRKFHRLQSQDKLEFPTRCINEIDYKVELYDPPRGIEEFNSVNPSYYRGAVGVIFFFDQTNYTSFNNIKEYWYSKVQENRRPGVGELEKPIMMLVRNKCDQVGTVSETDESELCNELGIKLRMKVNSTNGSHVKRSWETLMENIDKRVSHHSKASADIVDIESLHPEVILPTSCCM